MYTHAKSPLAGQTLPPIDAVRGMLLHRLDHPDNYSFILLIMDFIGSKYPSTISLYINKITACRANFPTDRCHQGNDIASVRSPRNLFICITNNGIYTIKVSQKYV